MDKGMTAQPHNERQVAADTEGAPRNQDKDAYEKQALSGDPVLPSRLPIYTPMESPYYTRYYPYVPFAMPQGTSMGHRPRCSSNSSNSESNGRPAKLKRENATLGQCGQALSSIPPKVQEIRALLAMLALDIKTLQFVHTKEDDITFKVLQQLMENKELADAALNDLITGVIDYHISMASAQLAQADQADQEGIP